MQKRRSSGRWERLKSLRESESIGYIRMGRDEWVKEEGGVLVERQTREGEVGSRRERGRNRVVPTYSAGVLRETGRKTPYQQFGSTVVGEVLEPYRGTRSQERKRQIKQQNRPGKIEFRRGQERDGRRGVYKNRLRQEEHHLVYEGVERERRRITRERRKSEQTTERWGLREKGYRESGKRERRKGVRARNWVEYNAIRVMEKTRVEEVERWIGRQKRESGGMKRGSEEKRRGRVDHRERAQGKGQGVVERRVTGEYWEKQEGEGTETERADQEELRVGREGRYGRRGKDGREWLENFRGVLKGLVTGEKEGWRQSMRQVDESLKRLVWWGGRTREGGASLVGTRGREIVADTGSTGSGRRGYTARCETERLGKERTVFWEGEAVRRSEVEKGQRATEAKGEGRSSRRGRDGKEGRSKVVQERFVRPKGRTRIQSRRRDTEEKGV